MSIIGQKTYSIRFLESIPPAVMIENLWILICLFIVCVCFFFRLTVFGFSGLMSHYSRKRSLVVAASGIIIVWCSCRKPSPRYCRPKHALLLSWAHSRQISVDKQLIFWSIIISISFHRFLPCFRGPFASTPHLSRGHSAGSLIKRILFYNSKIRVATAAASCTPFTADKLVKIYVKIRVIRHAQCNCEKPVPVVTLSKGRWWLPFTAACMHCLGT